MNCILSIDDRVSHEVVWPFNAILSRRRLPDRAKNVSVAWTGKESRFNSFGALNSKPVRTSEFLMSWLPMAIGGETSVERPNKIVRNSSFTVVNVFL